MVSGSHAQGLNCRRNDLIVRTALSSAKEGVDPSDATVVEPKVDRRFWTTGRGVSGWGGVKGGRAGNRSPLLEAPPG
jgi:hypothetical protein